MERTSAQRVKDYSKGPGPTWRDHFNDTLFKLEKAGSKLLGVRDIVNYASNAPERLYGKEEGDNSGGRGDALRHLLLSAELHRTHPTLAPIILNGHEYVTNVLQGQSSAARHMDIFNNKIGREIGLKAKSRSEVEKMALEAMPKAIQEE